MSGVSSPVYGGGYGSGSSFPGSVDYFNGVAVNKLGVDGPDAAITGPTSFGLRFTVPSGTDYPEDVVGGLTLSAADTLSFTDGTNTATLTGTFTAGEDVLVAVELYPSYKNIMRLARI